MHIWRQADCLSLTYGFANFNANFFSPEMHNLGNNGSGKAVSDFPLFYYLFSYIDQTKVSYLYRISVFVIFLFGIISVFKILEKVFKDSVIAILISTLLITSPALIFYSNNYLMNIPALSFSFIGYWFVSSYLNSKNKRDITLAYILFTLGALSKTPALIHLIIGTSIITWNFFTRNENRKKYLEFSLFPVISIFITVLWYSYAKWYNIENDTGNFLVGILPIWNLSSTEIQNLLNEIFFRKQDLFNPITFYVFLASFFKSVFDFFKFFKVKNIKWLISLLFLIYSGAFVVFFLLFFEVLNDHDYYFINWIPLFILSILIWEFDFKRTPKVKYAFYIIVSIYLIDSINLCKLRVGDKYQGWKNEYYSGYLKNIERIANKVGRHINTTERVIVPSDVTISASLYTLQRRGWSGYNEINSTEKIEHLKNFGLKFILIDKKRDYPIVPHFKKYCSLKDNLIEDDNFELYEIK